MDDKVYISVESDAYDEALKRLTTDEMPMVTFRKDNPLSMADDAVRALKKEMAEIAFLLQRR